MNTKYSTISQQNHGSYVREIVNKEEGGEADGIEGITGERAMAYHRRARGEHLTLKRDRCKKAEKNRAVSHTGHELPTHRFTD
jgi:hypothetical protein